LTDAPSTQREQSLSLGDTIHMGRIARAHGVTGELEIRPDWAESDGLLRAKEVVLESDSGALEVRAVRSSRRTPKGILMSLDGVTDRDAAEARRGYAVRVARDGLPKLGQGEYYLCDLVGANVDSPEGPVGRVVEVQMYPSVDALVIEAEDGERFEQPLLDDWVAQVDVAARRVTLASRDGLIDMPKVRGSTRAG
jgi:16S rRNA processing protein RimM